MIDIKRQNEEGVYFALSRNGNLLKVGATKEPEDRRYHLNNKTPKVNMGIVAMFGAGDAGSATWARDVERMAGDWLTAKGYRLHIPESDCAWEWFGQCNNQGKAIKLDDLAELACYVAEAAQKNISASEFAATSACKQQVASFKKKFEKCLRHFQKHGDLFYARHMTGQPNMVRKAFHKMGGPEGYELCVKVKQSRGVHYKMRLVTVTKKPNKTWNGIATA